MLNEVCLTRMVVFFELVRKTFTWGAIAILRIRAQKQNQNEIYTISHAAQFIFVRSIPIRCHSAHKHVGGVGLAFTHPVQVVQQLCKSLIVGGDTTFTNLG